MGPEEFARPFPREFQTFDSSEIVGPGVFARPFPWEFQMFDSSEIVGPGEFARPFPWEFQTFLLGPVCTFTPSVALITPLGCLWFVGW